MGAGMRAWRPLWQHGCEWSGVVFIPPLMMVVVMFMVFICVGDDGDGGDRGAGAGAGAGAARVRFGVGGGVDRCDCRDCSDGGDIPIQ